MFRIANNEYSSTVQHWHDGNKSGRVDLLFDARIS